MSRYQRFLVIVFVIVWLWTAYKPLFPDDWLLENYLVFVFVPILLISGYYFKLSNVSYTVLTVFLMLHVIGSHYTYEEVPFGFALQDFLGADRNMYDRFVHFSFGFLFAYPVREIFMRLAKTRGFWSYYFPIDLVLALSAIYEILEWLTAINVSLAAGIAFLGAQGDVWDAQKDMISAGTGALLAMLIIFCLNWYLDRDFTRQLRSSFTISKNDKPLGEVKLRELLGKIK